MGTMIKSSERESKTLDRTCIDSPPVSATNVSTGMVFVARRALPIMD